MKNRTKIIMGVVLAALFLFYAVSSKLPAFVGNTTENIDEMEENEKISPVGPAFDADKAFQLVKTQCDFGPRSMNSSGHEQCEAWIIEQFKQAGCDVQTQKADLKGYDGTTLRSTNIIAKYRPELTSRLLICAHWDSRPWADNDPDPANWHSPILAANDAASGVAVMLELARVLSTAETKPNVGIDFVCFDAEDWGTPQWEETTSEGDTWALGAQYFAENLPQGFEVRYGILVDMVGGQGAQFFQEGYSKQYAPQIVKKIWRAARQAGYGSYFPKREGGWITDDHVPLNQKAGIATVDIIPYYPDCEQSSFGPTWHTLADDIDHIDPATLKAVGQTLVQVIYTED